MLSGGLALVAGPHLAGWERIPGRLALLFGRIFSISSICEGDGSPDYLPRPEVEHVTVHSPAHSSDS